MLKFTILGCGSSSGVPQIACSCVVCRSQNPKNKRMRSSILLEVNNVSILIDTSPDFRQQALMNNITKIDAVLYTHAHSDHIAGADDIKTLVADKETVDVFATQKVKEILEVKFNYLFKQITPWYPQKMSLNVFDTEPFFIKNIKIIPVLQMHGESISHGFRVGDFMYSTDVNELDDDALHAINGVKTWVIGCIRYCKSPTHCNLEKALQWAARVNPENIILTHMSHEMEYDEILRILPNNIRPAYDGMNGFVRYE